MVTQTLLNAEVATRQTLTLDHGNGPVVVDRWLALNPDHRLPVLMVHGWGNSGSYWHQTAAALAETTEVIVPDLPGTGRSQPIQRPNDMYDQVQALVDVLDDLGLDRVHVVGHSMGGAMGVLLAARQPARVERLVLTSLSFFMNRQQERVYRSAIGLIKMTMRARAPWMVAVPGLARVMAKRYFERLPDDPEVLRQGFEEYLTLDFDTAVACANNAPDPSITAAGAQVAAPTLLVGCRGDHVMAKDNVAFTAATIPNCEVRWLDDCGHMPMIEQAPCYLEIVRTFLDI